MRTNVERCMRTGLRGVVLLGTNGEAPFVRDDEAVRARRRGTRGRPAPIACSSCGTGRQSTRQTIALLEARWRAPARMRSWC